MYKAQPLYTIEEQYAKLNTELPPSFSNINLIKFRLLLACSSNGNINSAKNRLLSFIQDTEMKVLFSSFLEVPASKETVGVNAVQIIHKKMEPLYGKIDIVLKELRTVGLPRRTLDVMEDYFSCNEDPIYKLSVLASSIMMAYIKEDEINNIKE